MFILVGFVMISHKWLMIAMIATGFIFVGIFQYQHYDSLQSRQGYSVGEVVIESKIVSPPEETNKSTRITIQDETTKTKILVITKPFFAGNMETR
jgi:hypothetical protein